MWGLPRGLLVVSVYLHVGMGLAGPNMDILTALAKELVNSKRLFVVQGDWNCQPQELERAGWPGLVGGTLVYVNEATCHGESSCTLDFFVVSNAMRGLVDGAFCVQEAPCSPHRPVGLSLAGLGKEPMITEAMRFKAFPHEIP